MNDELKSLLNTFMEYAIESENQFYSLMNAWPSSLNDPIVQRVLGSLLARQVHLSIQVAVTPGLWNGHTAPLVLRPLLEGFLKIAWMIQDPAARCAGVARADILGSLNKVSQLANAVAQMTSSEDTNWLAEPLIQLLNAELALFPEEQKPILVESREMANKVGGHALEMYRAYQVQFSSAVHSTWNHLGRFNLIPDSNPLHRFQLVPMYPEVELDFMPAVAAADFCDKSFRILGGDTSNSPGKPMIRLLGNLEAIGAINREKGSIEPESTSQ